MKLDQKLTLVAVISALAATAIGVTLLYKVASEQYLQNSVARLKHDTQVQANSEIRQMRTAEASLVVLAELLKKELQLPANPNELAEFDHLTAKDEHGVIRNRRELFDGKIEAGLFMAPDVKLTDEEKRIKLRAMKVLTRFGTAALRHYDGVWFDQLNKTSVIFWRRDPDFIYKLPPDHDYTQTLWDQLASPKLNPKRTAQWTPAILESPVGVWVVSAVYPLDINGQWQGILGHDIALTELLASFRATDAYTGSEHFLIDGFGNYILAGHWQKALESKPENFKPDFSNEPALKDLLDTTTPPKDVTRLQVGGRDYVAFALPIEGLNWHYYRLVPVDEVMAPMNHLFQSISLLVALIVAILALVMRNCISRLIAKPIARLTQIAENFGHDDFSLRSRMSGYDEVGRLGTAFDHMADHLESDRELIVNSEQRYRNVIEHVKEVIYQVDMTGRFTFLSPAWQTLSGYTPEESMGKHLWDYLEERHKKRKQNEFAEILRGERTPPCSGEYRLVAADGSARWVEIFIQLDNRAEQTFTGSMDDVTLRIQDQMLEDTYQMLGEMALRGSGTLNMLELSVLRLGEVFSCGVFAAQWQGDRCIKASYDAHLPPREDHQSALSLKDFAAPGSMRLSGENLPPALMELIQREYGVKSVLVIPISIGHEAVGRFIFLSNSEGAFAGDGEQSIRMAVDRIRILLQANHDQQWMQLIGSALETAANAVMITRDDGVIVWANTAMTKLSGYDREEILGNTPRLFNSGEHPPIFWQHLWETIRQGSAWSHEVINRHKDGTFYPIRQTVTPIQDMQGRVTHFISVQEDIRQEKASQDKLRYNATHDLLTGLPNRMLMQEHLQQAMNAAKRGKHVVGIIFIDLDHFKIINDSLGHQVGDDLLRQVTARLSGCLRVGDTLSRLGGDEFVVLLPGINTPLDAAVVAQKMLDSLHAPINIGIHELQTGCSIGISVFPLDGEDAETLLKNADTAMYTAKESGRNSYHFYVPEMNARVVKRMELERGLRRALERNEFELYYQPQLEIKSGRIIGLEALIRWQHPQQGLVSPADFIPVAEETGLIVPIGEWVLATACQQLATWQAAGVPLVTVAVNVSVRQFRQDAIVTAAERILRETGIQPHQIELELTESMMLESADQNTAILHKLHEMGFQLALDDFGTGFSSLGYLKRLPFHVLKIDRTFVQDIGLDNDDTTIAVSIIGLAHNLGMKAIAEGVETAEQRAFLRKHDCDFEQGFLFARPLPADEVALLLANTQEFTR